MFSSPCGEQVEVETNHMLCLLKCCSESFDLILESLVLLLHVVDLSRYKDHKSQTED